MLPDWVSNPGPLIYESGALPIVLRSPAQKLRKYNVHVSITVNVLGGISFHVIVRNWEHLKDTLALLLFLAC